MSTSISLDHSNVAKDWHARGFSCGLWIDHGGREWSYHTHQSDELFMILSGALELEVGGQSLSPAVGKEIRIPAGAPYIIRNVGEHTARWLYGQPRKSQQASHDQTHKRTVLKRKRKAEKRTAGIKIQNNV